MSQKLSQLCPCNMTHKLMVNVMNKLVTNSTKINLMQLLLLTYSVENTPPIMHACVGTLHSLLVSKFKK